MENLSLKNVPEPEVSSVYGFAWKVLKKYFWELLIISLIMMVAESPSGIFSGNHGNLSFGEGSFGFFFWLLIGGPVSYSSMFVFLKAVRGENFEIKDAFSCFGPNYVEIMLANFLTTFIIVFGFVFLIIPGIVFACKLAFVPYLVMDKKMKAMDAIKASWKMTSGYSWKIFFIGILMVFIILGGIILLFVGIFPAMIWVNGALATMYYAVDKKQPSVIEV